MLSGGTPKRLLHRQGQWTLEVVRQVAVDRSVYRPQTQQIEGPDFILKYLERNAQFRGLANSAGLLLRTPFGENNKSFDAVNGEWVPSVLAPSYLDQLKRRQRNNALEKQRVQLLSVQTECLRLRHSHAQLLRRVEDLERMLAGGAQVSPAHLANPASRAADAQPAEAHASAPQAPALESAAAVVAPAESASEVSAKEEAEPRAFTPIKLPPSSDFIRCIEQLIGGDVTAKEVTEPLDVSQASHWLSTIVDEHDNEVGAVIMNIQATVSLGGTLLMIPEDELKAQVASMKPSEDSLAASSEVCNALTGSVNSLDGNPSIRSNFMEPADLAKHGWLAKPSLTITLHDSFGGKTAVLAR